MDEHRGVPAGSPADVEASPAGEFQAVGGKLERGLIWVFIVLPSLALLPAVLFAWGGWIGWHDMVLLIVFYTLTTTGIGVGYHRGFTHGAFKSVRGLKIALAIAGSLALEGPVIRWVADHRKHHKFADREGDPHSPWRYGTSVWAVTKGFVFAHVGWVLWGQDRADPKRYAPDLLNDQDMAKISGLFRQLAAISLLAPALIGGLWDRSWHGAATGFFWGTLVRIALMHHVTFSINSICHVTGRRPFEARDRSGNVWWLALLSQGESWHNLHHADPTCARHGVLKGQIDINAWLIKQFERFGWAYDVRWPDSKRLKKKRAAVTA